MDEPISSSPDFLYPSGFTRFIELQEKILERHVTTQAPAPECYPGVLLAATEVVRHADPATRNGAYALEQVMDGLARVSYDSGDELPFLMMTWTGAYRLLNTRAPVTAEQALWRTAANSDPSLYAKYEGISQSLSRLGPSTAGIIHPKLVGLATSMLHNCFRG
ncbi:MAG: hypothetical protein AB7E52_05115 [Bdellovibrionales bacterium]